MLFSILSKLFGDDIYGRYSPKPQHLFYALLFMGVGTVTWFFDGWILFGVCTFIMGVLLGLTIIVGMNWEKVIEYWSTINEHIALMDKIKNPELWYALGYKKVPEQVRVIEDLNNDGHHLRFHNMPVSPAKMNILANKVLGTGKTIFSENEYSAIVPNFRKVKKEWTDKGFLKQNNSKNPRLGSSWTKKGMTMLYQFASDEYKLKNV